MVSDLIKIILLVILGASLGSFCMGIASRFCEKKPLFTMRSYCFSCENKLGILELIPLFSFLFLKAKCKTCKASISYMNFITELLGIFIIFLVFYKNEEFFKSLLLAALLFDLLILSLIDIKLKAVPQFLLWSAFFLAFFYAFNTDEFFVFFVFEELRQGFIFNAFIFAGAVFLFKSFVLFICNLRKKEELSENLGDADIIILALMAGILGLKYAFFALFLACILSLPFFAFSKNKELAMIPFLSFSFTLFLIFSKVKYEISL